MARDSVVHLFDGLILVFRAYYSLPQMPAPDGTPTHAAYGFANALIKYLNEHEPSHVAVAFDYSMESFRNEIEPDYKANRGETPDDLEPQFDLCVRVTEAELKKLRAEAKRRGVTLSALLLEPWRQKRKRH